MVNLPPAPRYLNPGVPTYVNGAMSLLDTVPPSVQLSTSYNSFTGETTISFIVDDPLAQVYFCFGDPAGPYTLWNGIPFLLSSFPGAGGTIYFFAVDDVGNQTPILSESLLPGLTLLYGYRFESADELRVFQNIAVPDFQGPIHFLGESLSPAYIEDITTTGDYYADIVSDVLAPGLREETVPQRYRVELDPTVPLPAGFAEQYSTGFENAGWRHGLTVEELGDATVSETIIVGTRPGSAGTKHALFGNIGGSVRLRVINGEVRRSAVSTLWLRTTGGVVGQVTRFMNRMVGDAETHYRANVTTRSGGTDVDFVVAFWKDGSETVLASATAFPIGSYDWLGVRFGTIDDVVNGWVSLALYLNPDDTGWVLAATLNDSSHNTDMFARRGTFGFVLDDASPRTTQAYELDDWVITA